MYTLVKDILVNISKDFVNYLFLNIMLNLFGK